MVLIVLAIEVIRQYYRALRPAASATPNSTLPIPQLVLRHSLFARRSLCLPAPHSRHPVHHLRKPVRIRLHSASRLELVFSQLFSRAFLFQSRSRCLNPHSFFLGCWPFHFLALAAPFRHALSRRLSGSLIFSFPAIPTGPASPLTAIAFSFLSVRFLFSALPYFSTALLNSSAPNAPLSPPRSRRSLSPHSGMPA